MQETYKRLEGIENLHEPMIICNEMHRFIVAEQLREKNIIHYDLKGSNILYSEKKKIPLIIDFGLSINMNNIDNLIKN